jgi:hypothetical protein
VQVQTLRRYRATVIPQNVSADEAELKADQGALPFVQFKATDSGRAALIANAVTGRPVLRVERRDEEALA